MLSTSTNEIIAAIMWRAAWVSVLMLLTFSELVSKGIAAFQNTQKHRGSNGRGDLVSEEEVTQQTGEISCTV